MRFSKKTGDFTHSYYQDLETPWLIFKKMLDLYRMLEIMKEYYTT